MSSEKTTLETIESVVSWYAGRPRDFADIDRLLYAAKTLATALFTFSGEVGALYKQKNRTEFQRKAGFLAAYRELMAAEPRPSVAAAEKEAETAVLDLRSEEQQADAEYTAAKMLLETARSVLDQMRQQISSLKTERSDKTQT